MDPSSSKPKLSLNLIISLGLLLLILPTLLLILIAARSSSVQNVQQAETLSLRKALSGFQATFEHAARDNNFIWIQEELAIYATDYLIHHSVLFEQNGKILASNQKGLIGKNIQDPGIFNQEEAEILQALLDSQSFHPNLSTRINPNGTEIYGVIPVNLGEMELFRDTNQKLLFINKDINPLIEQSYELAEDALINFLGFLLVIVLLGWLGLYFLLGRRVQKLALATQAYGQGNYQARAQVEGIDDLAFLARSIEAMAESRQQADQETQQANQRLLLLMDSLTSIVYVADHQTHTIIYINRLAEDIFGSVLGQPCDQGIPLQPNEERQPRLLSEVTLAEGIQFGAHNPTTGRDYQMSLRLIEWIDGRRVRLGIATDVTELKQAQAEIKTQQERLHFALEASQEGLWDAYFQTNQLFCSPRLLMLLGFAADQGPQTLPELEALTHPEDLPHVRELWDLHSQGILGVFEMELRILHQDQEYIWVESRGKIVERDAQGTPLRAVGTMADITYRKRFEEQIRKSEETLKQAQAIALMGSWSYDLETGSLSWSEELFKLYGYAPKSFAPSLDKIAESLTGQAKEDFLEHFSLEKLQQGLFEPFESRIRTQQGQVRILRHVGSLDQNNQGQFQLVGITQDITFEREQQQRISLLAKVYEHATEAILITNENNQIVEVNRAFSEITGYSFEEVKGQNPKILSSGRHDQDFYKIMWDAIRLEGRWEGEVWDRRKSGDIYPKLLSISRFHDDLSNETRYLGIFTDITRIKRSEEDLKKLAFFDSLTGLPNRAYFLEKLDGSIKTAKRNEQTMALMFLDLDNFKHVNDSLGHKAGDELLIKASQILTSKVRESDVVARLGGDEFVIILNDIQHLEDAAKVGQSIVDKISQPIEVAGELVYINTSIGISIYPNDGLKAPDLIKKADTAMYHSKEKGKGCYSYYTMDMEAKAERRLFLDQKLHEAIEKQEFVLFYQPQVDASNGQIIGVEALVRWNQPEWGFINPADFIPLAEETGLIVEIGDQILDMACQEVRRWKDQGIQPVPVSVNFSIKQFQQADLMKKIQKAMQNADIEPQWIKIEITESLLMEEIQKAIRTLHELRDAGLKSSIDDFGTGYSNLSYLKDFPVSDLKIDRAFIIDIVQDPRIAAAIINLAESLHLRVVAEGAETFDQVQRLYELGCRIIQGYYFAKPLPSKELEPFLKAGKILPEGFTGLG